MSQLTSLGERNGIDWPQAHEARAVVELVAQQPATLVLRPCVHRRFRKAAEVAGKAKIGFTGPPGAGKSTLIDAYIAALRTRGHSVAVAAVDPSSPISGGAVLGDRMRMRRHAEDPGVFIRSVASHGHLGGLSESIHRIVDAMDAAGRDFIIIETVGAGQSEVEVVEIADICVVVNAPNMGDEVQAMKAGILEIADVLVVNKADLPLAQRTTKQLTNMLELRRQNRDVPVLETVALTETGIDALHDAIMSRLAASAGDKRKQARAAHASAHRRLRRPHRPRSHSRCGRRVGRPGSSRRVGGDRR